MSKVYLVERRFVVTIQCKECGRELNRTPIMTRAGVLERWMSLVLSSALVTPACTTGCRSTFSDCNINTRMVVQDADTKEVFDLIGRTLADALPESREEVM